MCGTSWNVELQHVFHDRRTGISWSRQCRKSGNSSHNTDYADLWPVWGGDALHASLLLVDTPSIEICKLNFNLNSTFMDVIWLRRLLSIWFNLGLNVSLLLTQYHLIQHLSTCYGNNLWLELKYSYMILVMRFHWLSVYAHVFNFVHDKLAWQFNFFVIQW